MTRERLPDRRAVWRQKVVIHDPVSGPQSFFIDYGEYPDGRLAELFITAARAGTFVRGTLDALARGVSLSLQRGSPPSEVAGTLLGLDYPPQGRVEAAGSPVESCTSLADYLGQEITACYVDVVDVGEGSGPPPALPLPAEVQPPAPPPPGRQPKYDWQAYADAAGEPVLILDVKYSPIWQRAERDFEGPVRLSEATEFDRKHALATVHPRTKETAT